MYRRFNTAGPNDPQDHHTLPVLARLPDFRRLIDEKLYFVLHAPRQSGKTTALLTLARELTSDGPYAAVVLSMQSGAPFREQVGMAEDAILDAWQGAASRRLPPELRPPAWPSAPPGHRISRALQAWAEEAPRPLVVLLDDVDALEGASLLTVLRELRGGFPDRPHHFPWSLVLAGMRDAPDYAIASGLGGHAGAEDPFDVRSDSRTLHDFSREGVEALYRKHTEDTGQVFLPAAIDCVYRLTGGQPWLVSALARQMVEVIVQDRATAITAPDAEAAREILVRGHKAHFDSLAERLHEPRLRGILEPLLRGEPLDAVPGEDRRLALDLGLVRSSEEGALAIANPIYHEVLARLLASGRRAAPPQLTATWISDEDLLDDEQPPAEAEQLPGYEAEPGQSRSEPGRSPIVAPETIASHPVAPELAEWFLPISTGPSGVAGEADEERDVATGRRERRRSWARRTVAIAGTVGALLVMTAWLAIGSDGPATPGALSSVVRTLQPTETPRSAPGASPSAAAAVPVSAEPMPPPRDAQGPSSDPDGSRASAPARITRVPGPMPAGAIRMVKAICPSTADRRCRDRAREMLKRKEQAPGMGSLTAVRTPPPVSE